MSTVLGICNQSRDPQNKNTSYWSDFNSAELTLAFRFFNKATKKGNFQMTLKWLFI